MKKGVIVAIAVVIAAVIVIVLVAGGKGSSGPVTDLSKSGTAIPEEHKPKMEEGRQAGMDWAQKTQQRYEEEKAKAKK